MKTNWIVAVALLATSLSAQVSDEQLRTQGAVVIQHLSAAAEEFDTARKQFGPKDRDKYQIWKKAFIARTAPTLDDANSIFAQLYTRVDKAVQVEGRSRAPNAGEALNSERLRMCGFHLQELLDKLPK